MVRRFSSTVYGVVLFGISFAMSSCAIFDLSNEYGKDATMRESESKQLQYVIKHAAYDVYNVQVLKNIDEWKGRVVSFTGSYNDNPFLDEKRQDIVQVSGRINNYLVDFMLLLDHPIKQPGMIYESGSVVSNFSHVRVFAEVVESREFTFESGSKRILPVAKLIALFRHDDRMMTTPLWQRKSK